MRRAALGRLYGSLMIGYTTDSAPTTCSTSLPLATLGLPALTQIDGDLRVNATQLAGIPLPAVTQITGGLAITANPVLTSLAGLSEIEGVGLRLQIDNNPQLATLGMTGLTSVSGLLAPESRSYAIRNNVLLPTCDAQALYNQLTLKPVGTIGFVGITGNKAPTTCP